MKLTHVTASFPSPSPFNPPPLPHPHRAPHAALVAVVGLHFQHMGAAGFSVQSPEASCHQPGLSVYAEQTVAVPCTHTHKSTNTHTTAHTEEDTEQDL